MATVLYINPDSNAGPARATSLGAGWMATAPAQFASVASNPPVVVLSGAGTTVVLSDTPPLTAAAVASALAPILSAEQAVAAAAAAAAVNTAALQAAIVARLAQIETFIAANPGGAVLTGPQTITLARMLAGLGRVVLGLTTTVGQGG